MICHLQTGDLEKASGVFQPKSEGLRTRRVKDVDSSLCLMAQEPRAPGAREEQCSSPGN